LLAGGVIETTRTARIMSVPHYVSDYKRLTDELIRTHPIDEAMSLAVGGGYHEIGPLLCQLVANAGLEDGGSIVDVGCGSGRLATYLAERFRTIDYLGIDVVPELVSYAASKCPANYRFATSDDLRIPAEDASADMVVAFSVFTHLFQEESYTYLLEARRILKPGGAIVFSFLEFDRHWSIFETMLTREWLDARPHLNMFLDRNTIELWARKLGFVTTYDLAPSIGQSTVLYRA
jgi:ubiquinone/menaquinone biosynthesis C-methylase UbiE